MRAQLRWLGLALTAIAFIWAYNATKGNSLQSLNMAVRIATLFVALDIVLKYREDRSASGLSKEQFMLSKAGGPSGLQRQAKGAHFAAYSLIFIWLGMSLLLAMSSISVGLIVFGILGLVFLPCSVYLFRLARNQSNIAEHAQRVAGTKASATHE